LLEGRPESDAENNAAAVRVTEHRRRIKPIPPADKSSRTVRGGADADTDADSDDVAAPAAGSRKRPAKPPLRPSKGTVKRPRNRSPQVIDDSDDSDSGGRQASRHKPVSTSAIYKTYEGPILSDVRRRFQTLIVARDGFPLKSLTIHRDINFKLALLAAKDVMEKRMYTEFKNAMEHALKDTSKA
jgi:hypothetical protein